MSIQRPQHPTRTSRPIFILIIIDHYCGWIECMWYFCSTSCAYETGWNWIKYMCDLEWVTAVMNGVCMCVVCVFSCPCSWQLHSRKFWTVRRTFKIRATQTFFEINFSGVVFPSNALHPFSTGVARRCYRRKLRTALTLTDWGASACLVSSLRKRTYFWNPVSVDCYS